MYVHVFCIESIFTLLLFSQIVQQRTEAGLFGLICQCYLFCVVCFFWVFFNFAELEVAVSLLPRFC